MKFVFLHIEKTAGTSLVSYFKDIFGEDNFLYVRPDELKKLKEEGVLDEKRMIAGHFGYRDIEKFMPDRKVITFLRDPIKRLESFYNYVKTMPETKDIITTASRRLDIDGFLDDCKRRDDRRFVNGMTFKLASDGPCSLETALENLENIDFIGLQENFNESINMMAEKFDWPKIESAPRVNVTKGKEKKDFSEDTMNTLKSLNNHDRIIYQNGKKIFVNYGKIRKIEIFDNLTEKNIDDIRDAAMRLEKYHFDYAVRLMKLAHELRPKEPNARYKVSEHKKNTSRPYYDKNIKDEVELSERLNIYLGNALNHDISHFNEKILSNKFVFDELKIDTIMAYSLNRNGKQKNIKINYQKDMDRFLSQLNYNNKILTVFGDMVVKGAQLPIFTKVRYVNDKKENILLKLNSKRHFTYLNDTIPWNRKKNEVIWRGATTGKPSSQNDRFKLVSKYASKYDIGFADIIQNKDLWYKLIEDNEFLYKKNKVSMYYQFKYKYILSIDGNDIASNLKWILASNSIPIMKKPIKETWLMESKLIPYKHYVPLSDDIDDLDEVLEWCYDNDEECRQMAINGQRFMNMFYSQENEDFLNKRILEEYMKIYDKETYEKYRLNTH